MRIVLLAAALLVGAVPAIAEETVIHREGPGPAAGPGPARDVTVEKHSDCASKTVHKEDDAGDSKTVTKSNCD